MYYITLQNKLGAGKGTVREHIAVEVVAYSVAIEAYQAVVGVILEAAIGCRGYVTCCIVVEGLGRYNRVIAELLDSSRSDSAEIIISITHFGRICKHQEKTAAPESAAENHCAFSIGCSQTSSSTIFPDPSTAM